MKFDEALGYANKIVFEIVDLCEKVAIVGSIRRKRPEVHDVDLVVIPKSCPPFYDFTWDAIATRLQKNLNMQLIKKGREMIVLGFREVDLPVDIYRATPEKWGVILLIRTGSKEYNIYLCQRAHELELKLSAREGVTTLEGKVIASETEEDIFKALGMDFVEPERR